MRRALLVTGLVLPLLVGGTGAHADPGSTTRDGKTLTVSKATELRTEGEKVRVRGSGYDRNKGIYVAFCVDNGPGQVPTPCGGGADTEGSSGNSVWISDFPPAYGTGLAQPYGEGGSFDVEIFVRAVLRVDDPETAEDETVDCRTTRCAVVTRNDHTRSDDRSQDVAVPIAFGSPRPPAPAPSPSPVIEAPAQQEGSPAAPAAEQTRPAATPASTSPSPAASPTTSQVAAAATSPSPLAAGPSDVRSEPTSSGGTSGWLPLLLAAGAVSAAGAGALGLRRRVRGGT